MKYEIYGDGVRDDYYGIQEMLDGGMSEITLPMPEKNYLISKTLIIHSGQKLKLPRFARVVLADNANCSMIENDTREYCEGVFLSGGVWDMNHSRQLPNPYRFPQGKTYEEQCKEFGWTEYDQTLFPGYSGHCMRFCGINNFELKNVTIVNPVVYGIQIAFVENFTVKNIVFDYTEGSPKLWNMDGVHVEGGCKNGYINNLKGACHDDLVAITSDDSIRGPIENIAVDGIFAENCHSAVRLLSAETPVKNISINNVFGSYYVYCITISKYIDINGNRGKFSNVTINNVFASFCEGTKDVVGNYYAFIQIDKELDVENLSISNVFRDEKVCFTPTIGVYADTVVKNLSLHNVRQSSPDGTDMPFIKNDGKFINPDFGNTGYEEK